MSHSAGFAAYRIYLDIRNHFHEKGYTSKGMFVRVGVDAFYKRKDRKWFEALASRLSNPKALREYIISCFLKNKSFWIGEFGADDNITYHTERMKRLKSIVHVFRQDMVRLVDEGQYTISQLLTDADQTAIIASLLTKKEVSLETAAVLDLFFSYTMRSDSINPMWQKKKLEVYKYALLIRLEESQRTAIKQSIDKDLLKKCHCAR